MNSARSFVRCVLRSALFSLGVMTAAALSAHSSARAEPSAPSAKRGAQKGGKGQKGAGKGAQKGKEDKKKGGKAAASSSHGSPSAGASSPARADAPPSGAPEARAGAKPAAPIELNLTVQRATLDNGLRVVTNPDHTSPTVAITVTYDVGSRDEERGRSGFAHLFEHMMFQGSKNVDKGAHSLLVSSHGGVLNGTTNNDRTTYFETLPANELALGLWLEADRMKSLDISETNFENQRKVVEEEYRMRVSNAAYVPSEIRLEELVYQGYFPYEHSSIGSMADLDGAKLEWVADFHARHYGPNNAVLSISGDFEAEEAMRLIHRYFDAVPKVAVTPFESIPFPEQTSQRTAVVRDDNARTPGILYGFAIPPSRSADHYALDLAAILLGEGESSRLYQLLVRDKALVQDVSASTEARRGPDLFTIDMKLADGAKVFDVEKLVDGELKTLGTSGPTEAEMEKARRQIQAKLVLSLQSNLGRAVRLGRYEVSFGDASLLNAELPRYFAVTREDIKRLSAQHIAPTHRSIVETYPSDGGPIDKPSAKGKGDGGAAPSKPSLSPGEGRAKKSGKASSSSEGKAKKGSAGASAGKAKKSKK